MIFFRFFILLPISLSFLIIYIASFFIADIHIDKGGINKTINPIALRKKADDSLDAVVYLDPNEFAIIENNNAERWIYIYHQKNILAVPRIEFDDGYIRAFNIVLPSDTWDTLKIKLTTSRKTTSATAVIFLALFFLLDIKKRKSNRNFKKPAVRKSRHYNRKKINVDNNQMSPTQDRDKNTVAYTSNTESTPEYIPHPTTELIPEPTPKSISIDKNRNPTKKELINQAIERISKEKDLEYKGKIEEMEIAAKAIQQAFNNAHETALIFGIDLKDSNLDNLAKGRLFEVYGAKYWHQDDRLSIIDWTPDKGFHHDIEVRSNGNPDFLIEVDTQSLPKKIAIEAKYRNAHFPLNPDKTQARLFCAFEKRYKIERYNKFSVKQSCPIYILIGIGNTASDPEDLYLVPISKILELKAEDKFGRLSMESVEVEKYRIMPEHFYSLFLNITKNFYEPSLLDILE